MGRQREEFTAKTREQAHERACGRCEWVEAGLRCDAILAPGNVHYDHIIPWAISRDSTLANCQALCRAHHALKTARDDVPTIAKVKRQHRNHIGASVSTSPPIQSRGDLRRGPREPKRLSPEKQLPPPRLYKDA